MSHSEAFVTYRDTALVCLMKLLLKNGFKSKTNRATLYNLLVKARPNETFNFGTCKQILSFTVSEEK